MVAILKERTPLFLISSSGGTSCDGHNIAHSAFLIDSQIVPQRPEEGRAGASALVRMEAPVIPRLDGALFFRGGGEDRDSNKMNRNQRLCLREQEYSCFGHGEHNPTK